MLFIKRENSEAIGESLNRQLRVPRQNAFGKLTWQAEFERVVGFFKNLKD